MTKVIPMLIIAAAVLFGGNSAMADTCSDMLATYQKMAVDNAAGYEEVIKGRKERDASTGSGKDFDRDKWDLAASKQRCAEAQFRMHTESATHIYGKALMKVCGKRAVFGCGSPKRCHYYFDQFDADRKADVKNYCDAYEELKKKAETR